MKLYNGNCLEVMQTLPDKSVNLIVADPPYNIGKADWDKIPNYIEWCGKWLKECQRALADNGSMYIFHNDMEQIADLMLWIRENTEFVFKQFIVWNKRFEGVRNKGFLDGFIVPDGLRNYQQMAEYILYYTFQDETGLSKIYSDRDCFQSIKYYMRGERDKIIEREGFSTIEQFNQWVNAITNTSSVASRHYFADSQWTLPTEEMYQRLQSSGLWSREYEDLRREYEDLRYTFNNQKTHHSVWNYEIAERNGHITPKPVELIENIIRHSSNEGDTILDPFMGSGTTGIGAINEGRDFIGIELDPDYYEIARRRIEYWQAQPRQLTLDNGTERE